MVTGPQQQRLDLALSGSSAEAITAGSAEWDRCASLLSTVARALEVASVTGQGLGGRTGPAMSAALSQTSAGMAGKGHELRRGNRALTAAGNAIVAARVGESEMNRYHPQQPHPGTYTPPPGPLDHQDLLDQKAHQKGVNDYQVSFDSRENIARQLADRIDRDFQASTETMKSIHGEPDPPVDGGGGTTAGPKPISVAPPSGGRAPSGVVTTTGGDPTDPPHDPGTDDPRDPDGPTHPDHTTTPVSDVPTHHSDPPTTTPVPDHGDGVPYPGTTGVIGDSGGISGPLAGGLGVAAGGGLAGAAIGGLRGGLAPTGSVPGAAARPIGSSTRGGASGALGRGASGTGSPTSRPTGSGAGGRGGGRSAASAGGGASGRRGAADAGAGAGGGRRGGKKDQDEHGRDRDLFDDGQEWIDDAEAAPGVID